MATLIKAPTRIEAAGHPPKIIQEFIGRVETKSETIDVAAGQAIITPGGEWVRYSTPGAEGAEYIAVCMPAFSPDTVHRK